MSLDTGNSDIGNSDIGNSDIGNSDIGNSEIAHLASTPSAARRLLPLVLLLTVIPWLGMALAVLGGVRAGIGAEDVHLAEILIPLALGLPVAGFIATETLAYMLGNRLLRPTSLLVQVARDAARHDFRHVPPPVGADETGHLSVALGRLIRHLARRRRDLDAMALEIAGQGLVAGGAARAARLLAEQAPPARLLANEPDPLAAWLNPALHRLLCALASGVVVLGAARLDAEAIVAVVATALLAGRLADRLRRLGGWLLWPVLLAALGLWLLPEAIGPALLPRSLAAAAAASLALHIGSGWRGPSQGIAAGDAAADAGWQKAGLAGALAGGGVAAALVGIANPGLIGSLMPLPLLALGLAATPRGSAPNPLIRAGWPGVAVTLRLLRQPALPRLVFLEALPAGMMLGLAMALAAARPALAVAVVVLASLFAGARGATPRRRLGRWPAALALAAALGFMEFGLAAAAAPFAAIGAILAWPSSRPPASCTSPRQFALLTMLARAVGVVLSLLVTGAWLTDSAIRAGWTP